MSLDRTVQYSAEYTNRQHSIGQLLLDQESQLYDILDANQHDDIRE